VEIRARYLLVGLFVLIVAIGGAGFIYWLANTGGLGERVSYRIRFDGPISGLTRGSAVQFNGLTVGEVTDLRLVPDNPSQVMATIAVDSGTPVRSDTHIGLDFGGLTGTATVAMSGGTTAVPASTDGGPPLTEFTAASAGPTSPFGDDHGFPLPLSHIRYAHPTDKPNRAGVQLVEGR